MVRLSFLDRLGMTPNPSAGSYIYMACSILSSEIIRCGEKKRIGKEAGFVSGSC